MSSVNYLIEPKDNPGQDPLIVHVSRIKPYYERMDEVIHEDKKRPLCQSPQIIPTYLDIQPPKSRIHKKKRAAKVRSQRPEPSATPSPQLFRKKKL
ncbi:hypothetical protein LAZ67_12001974 [Cordylochernes scorpioides]|uniref:Uncharacterized protein n=1 Tax=Cordylochernes scorpioides TaxID=51811 RepID=A0ABY6L6C5_9ARAC|nr:hypothetical protein LAZ67_12001974 [Cordylochernes scorpioides]